MSARTKRAPERPSGQFVALPHSVIDSAAWKACSGPARALLIDLCRQVNGHNNGHLHLARSWIEARGWTRPATVKRLRDELIRYRLIVQTRHGGLNNGAHQYAVTWLPISDWRELDMPRQDYHPGAYQLAPLEVSKEKKPRTPYVLAKAPTRTPCVLEAESPRTPCVRETALLDPLPRTPCVHNVLAIAGGNSSARFIGGKPRAAQLAARAWRH
jgi:hypothetical protein